MMELLLDCLGIEVGTAEKDEEVPKLKRRQVTSILVLQHLHVNCGHLHQIPRANPEHAGLPGLNCGEACMEYEGESWLPHLQVPRGPRLT